MLRSYETVFVLTPVLSEKEIKDAVDKFRKIIVERGESKIVHEENLGLKKLAYPIGKKLTGVYQLFEIQANPQFVATLETEYKRDERILRFLVVSLDKHGVAYNHNRRNYLAEKATKSAESQEESAPAQE